MITCHLVLCHHTCFVMCVFHLPSRMPGTLHSLTHFRHSSLSLGCSRACQGCSADSLMPPRSWPDTAGCWCDAQEGDCSHTLLPHSVSYSCCAWRGAHLPSLEFVIWLALCLTPEPTWEEFNQPRDPRLIRRPHQQSPETIPRPPSGSPPPLQLTRGTWTAGAPSIS